MELSPEITWSDQINLHSIETITTLQNKLVSWEWWIVNASVAGDCREAFVFFFPLLAGLSVSCASKMLWAAIFAEWSNLIIKWLCHGDRPYWYVPETPHYNTTTRPLLRQFPNTCESGPGTPSGHLMMNVAIFYICAKSICLLLIWDNRLFSRNGQRVAAAVVYGVWVAWVALLMLSRVYIQAHFLHQCVIGALVGLAVGEWCWRAESLLQLGQLGTLAVASSLSLSAAVVWAGLTAGGYEPLWSVAKALRHCHDPVLVTVDAQPYFLMARFTGAALGLGFGVSSGAGRAVMGAPGRLLRTVLASKAGMFLGRLAVIILNSLPRHDIAVYVMLGLIVHAVLPLIIVTALPTFLLRVLPPGGRAKNKSN